jgi:hypothetical protein
MRWTTAVLAALSSLLLPAAAMAAGAAPSAASGPPIVIGGTVSQTGAFAEDAEYQVKGMQLAVADANAQGGWLGRKLEFKVYDDKSNAGTAVLLYTRLITEDHVNLLVGPYSSGITQAVAPLINKYRMATIERQISSVVAAARDRAEIRHRAGGAADIYAVGAAQNLRLRSAGRTVGDPATLTEGNAVVCLARYCAKIRHYSRTMVYRHPNSSRDRRARCAVGDCSALQLNPR